MNDAKIIALTQPLIESYKDQANKPVYMTANEFIAYRSEEHTSELQSH